MNKKLSSIASQLLTPVAALLLMGTGQANAASVIYVLNQSDALADGVGYLQVTVADGAAGAINFTVQALQPLLDLADDDFLGIQSFAFNVAPGGDAEASEITLPDGWTARDHYKADGFGFFDIKLYGGGDSQLTSLEFSIDNIDGDSIQDYTVLSTGTATNGHQLFAARVSGIESGCNEIGVRCVTTAFVGGSTASSPVPLPATAWLFGAGLLGVVLRSRRRR